MKRGSFVQPTPSTQIWIYYTSKLVGVVEERFNYDSSQFLADIGGSLGFLLGLSVLGFIGILGNVGEAFETSCNFLKQRFCRSYRRR